MLPLRPSLRHPTLFGAAFTLMLFGILGGRPRLWEVAGPTILFGATSAFVIMGCIGVALSFRWTRPVTVTATTPPPFKATRLISGGSLTLTTLFLTDWFTRGYSFFRGPSVRPETAVIAAALFYLARQSPSVRRVALTLLPLVGSALCFGSFLSYANGRTLISDDHAVFLYRLELLKEQFPSIPFYYPLWNGGLDARDFFASGVLNLFLLFYPIIAVFNLWQSYTAIIAITLFVINPLSMAIAARLLRFSRPVTALAATLSLGSSLLWYRWALSYGTMGFIVATALAPLCWAAWFRIAQGDERVSAPLWVLTYSVTTLVSFWTLAPLAIAPIALAFIPNRCKGLFRVRVVTLLVALAATNLPWMALFVSVSRVTSFLAAEHSAIHETISETTSTRSDSTSSHSVQKLAPAQSLRPPSQSFRHKSHYPSPRQTVTNLRNWAISVNPLILIFGPLGIFFLPRALRIMMIVQGGWLLGIGAIIVSIKPQLELDRMLVVLAHLGCIPTAVSLRALLRVHRFKSLPPSGYLQISRNGLLLVSHLLSLSLLALTPLYGSSIAQNRSVEPVHFSSPTYDAISETIRNHAAGGRTLFSGQVLHELDQGHVAPLTVLTGHPIVASSPFHNIWSYQQVVPLSFLGQDEAGIERYFDLMNVSLVFAHDPKWRQWFEERPLRYKKVLQGPPFMAYSRKQEGSSYFVEGKGSILAQRTNSVTVLPETPDGVISFNWFPFLMSDSCSLSPHRISDELTFIKFSGCQPERPFTISSVSPVRRFAYHLKGY